MKIYIFISFSARLPTLHDRRYVCLEAWKDEDRDILLHAANAVLRARTAGFRNLSQSEQKAINAQAAYFQDIQRLSNPAARPEQTNWQLLGGLSEQNPSVSSVAKPGGVLLHRLQERGTSLQCPDR